MTLSLVPQQSTQELEADAHEWTRLLASQAERIVEAQASGNASEIRVACAAARAIAALAGAASKVMPRAEMEARLAELEQLIASKRKRERIGVG